MNVPAIVHTCSDIFLGKRIGLNDSTINNRLLLLIKFNLVNRSSWNDQIIAITKFKVAIHRFQHSASFMNKNHFIRIGILIKIILHAFLSVLPGQYDNHC